MNNHIELNPSCTNEQIMQQKMLARSGVQIDKPSSHDNRVCDISRRLQSTPKTYLLCMAVTNAEICGDGGT